MPSLIQLFLEEQADNSAQSYWVSIRAQEKIEANKKKKFTLKVEKFRNESWYFRFGAWLSKPSPIIDLASVYGQVGLSF